MYRDCTSIPSQIEEYGDMVITVVIAKARAGVTGYSPSISSHSLTYRAAVTGLESFRK